MEVITSRDLFLTIVNFLPGRPVFAERLLRQYCLDLFQQDQPPPWLDQDPDWWESRIAMIALHYGDLDALQLLHRHAANPQKRPECELSPSKILPVAARFGRIEALEWLRANAVVSMSAKDVILPAIEHGRVDVVQWAMWTFGDSAHKAITDTAVALAAHNGHLEMLEYLLSSGFRQREHEHEGIMAIERVKESIKLSAKVVEGFGRGGKQLGCPTANLCREELGSKLDELPTGIYCGWATVDGKGPYKAVASIGWNPYFQNKEKTVEPHLLHKFDEDFYGARLKFVICGYLRPEMNFPSLEALIDAIQNDIAQSEAWLELPEGQQWRNDDFFTL
ncbi:hypothetical protein ATCC90586_006406 [Pythium insidiosum]|nr:hypothetical protein ATCC90586_006406 [Pythium insidiosum]